ncbi:DUF4838 domain-containing protein [Sphingobacterium lactis]|uniref:DUF4838 domain-containing protein n=1 Tax=Sphingobacterium lactis TaxID=797291 RepID=UPI003F7CE738
MYRFNFILLMLFLLLLSCTNSYSQLAADGYVILNEGDAKSEKWASYLFDHLKKRAKDTSILQVANTDANIPKGYKSIYIHFDEDLEQDYSISNVSQRLHITVKSDRVALWMVYQLIDRIAEVNTNFDSSDISPAWINFHDHQKSFDFSYREPHYQPNTDLDIAAIWNTNNVDVDWGIWGHNLSRFIKDDKDVYATYQDKLNKNQFCFSSDGLFHQLEHYILDTYGKGRHDKPTYFMIAPNDNQIACTCDRCTELGNKEVNSTATVVHLINRLSEKFPFHKFFTIVYGPVKEAPEHGLADNAGVFISTIDIPKGKPLSDGKAFKSFQNLLYQWKAKTDNIFLWDYASNFDDYLSPQPSLLALQNQLKTFKSLGINGLFLNASGYDYSSFDDVKNYVSAALMFDSELSVNDLVRRYFKRFYPKTHELLSEYYLQLENQSFSNKKGYELYAAFPQITKTYFSISSFQDFNKHLELVYKSAGEDEQSRLRKLRLALLYTNLQIAYFNGLQKDGAFMKKSDRISVKQEINQLLDRFEGEAKATEIAIYKESEGSISNYLKDWRSYSSINSKINLLNPKALNAIGQDPVSASEIDLLANNVLGFPSDFNQGWVIRNQETHLQFNVPDTNPKELVIRQLIHKKHRFNTIQSIIVKQNNKILLKKEFKTVSSSHEVIETRLKLPILQKDVAVDLILVPAKNENQRIAIDEIQILNL